MGKLRIPVICGHRTKGLWWFRIFGWGLHWKNYRHHRPLFSDRYRLKWGVLRLGRWHFELLRRRDYGVLA